MLKLYLRYEAQLHRHYKSCLQQLQDLQAARLPEVKPEPDPGLATNPAQTSPDRTSPDRNEGDIPRDIPPAASPSEPKPVDTNPAREQGDVPRAPRPNEPKLTPEQEEIRRYEEHRDRLIARAMARKEQLA